MAIIWLIMDMFLNFYPLIQFRYKQSQYTLLTKHVGFLFSSLLIYSFLSQYFPIRKDLASFSNIKLSNLLPTSELNDCDWFFYYSKLRIDSFGFSHSAGLISRFLSDVIDQNLDLAFKNFKKFLRGLCLTKEDIHGKELQLLWSFPNISFYSFLSY